MKKAKEATAQYQTTTKKPAPNSAMAAPMTATTVTISTDLIERLQQAAEWKGLSLTEAMSEAVVIISISTLTRKWLRSKSFLKK